MAFSTYYKFSGAFYMQLLLIILIALTIRVCVSMWGHSGEGKPPMYGDFEAQRHWMEITVNLPVEEWYVNTEANDLQYWGLDYPPLTAYHMMINGRIAEYYNSSIVELETSRGLEGSSVKFFMRATVLVMDLLLFLPAAVAFFILESRKYGHESEKNILAYILVLVAYPGLLLIDNGHFQYNNVSLGFLILATLALTLKYDLVAAFLFCLSLNYKQMELYHALPFFAYLMGSCLKTKSAKGLHQFFMLALVVIITFVTIWSPFLYSKDSALAVLQRLFPFKRGLYEDKVANFWCSASVLIKFKEIFEQSTMAIICLLVTATAILPSFLHLLKHPSIQNFHYASINSSLIFFLFSFHVHEKSILLAAIPVCLIVNTDPLMVLWFLLMSVFSMLPLLMKDGLLIPTVATVCIYWQTITYFLQPAESVSEDFRKAFRLSLLFAVCLAVAAVFVPPPLRYPDLHPMLIAMYSCGHFIMFAIYFHIKQFGYYHKFKQFVEQYAYEEKSKDETHHNRDGIGSRTRSKMKKDAMSRPTEARRRRV